MSHSFIYFSRVIVEDGEVRVQSKSFDNNIEPWPDMETLAEKPYFTSVAFKAQSFDPLAAREWFEELSRGYDGGSYRDRAEHIDGRLAYMRWARRMREAGFPIPAARPWRCLYAPTQTLAELPTAIQFVEDTRISQMVGETSMEAVAPTLFVFADKDGFVDQNCLHPPFPRPFARFWSEADANEILARAQKHFPRWPLRAVAASSSPVLKAALANAVAP